MAPAAIDELFLLQPSRFWRYNLRAYDMYDLKIFKKLIDALSMVTFHFNAAYNINLEISHVKREIVLFEKARLPYWSFECLVKCTRPK